MITKTTKYKTQKEPLLATEKAANGRTRLFWTKTTSTSKYKVYRATSKNGTYRLIKTTTGKNYTDTSAKYGTKYYYKVKAYRVVEGKTYYSDFTGYRYILTRVAVPTIEKVSKKNYNTLTISWNSVEGATGYRVYRSTSKNGEYKRVATLNGSNKLSYSDTGLVCGRRYYYKVRAYRTVDGTKYHGS